MPEKTWWLVVRHSAPPPGGFYPPEGVGIIAYDDEERAKLYAVNSTTSRDFYEAIPVSRVS